MSFFSKENPDRWHQLAWWLCVITLPWLDMLNNLSLIFLATVSIVGPHLKERFLRIKTARWTWPFFAYYTLLLVGMVYTPDADSGLFDLNKKITFLALPIIAILGKELNEEFIGSLKRSFVYSCTFVIFLCLAAAAVNFFENGSTHNFDVSTIASFNDLHPNASGAWMNFSYVQLAGWAKIHPAYFSMYLVFCIVILVTDRNLFRGRRSAYFLIGVLMTCFIALLSTRMAIITLFVVSLYLIINNLFHRQFKEVAYLSVVLLFFGAVLWINPVARFRVIEEPMKTRYVANTSVTTWNSVSYRLLEWDVSWDIIKNNLWLGVGTSGWKVAMDAYYSNYNSSTVGLNFNSHNQFLQTWMENGIFALLVFLVCVFGYLFQFKGDPAYVAFIAIFSLMCLTDSMIERQKGVVFFTLFQTLFLAFPTKSK